MNSLNSLPHDTAIPLWITQSVRHQATVFARQQPSAHKAEQVYRNTLAVGVVNSYLSLLGIQTDLAAADSWNAAIRLASDVADLVVVGRGTLECRAVDPDAETCSIPLENQGDRIGYVIVRLDSDQEATLLGFVAQVQAETLPLKELRPMVDLPGYLAQQPPTVNLRLWLEGLYQLDWQPPEALLRPKQLVLSQPQSEFQRAKLIELNLDSEHRDVVLLCSVMPEPEALSVRVQLHPAILAEPQPNGTRLIHSTLDCLIPNIKLSLKTEDNQLFKEVMSRPFPRDNCIQLPLFQGELGERFTILIAINDLIISEQFQL